jgi:hypothetical protein
MVSGATAADLLSQVTPSAPGYCTKDLQSLGALSNQGVCGGTNSNIGSQVTIEWNQDCDQSGSIRMGFDWGQGGGVIVDGVLVQSTNGNPDNAYAPLWWNGNWNFQSAVFTVTKLWTKGHHVVKFIGFEGCCDGNEIVQYKANNAAVWSTLDSGFLSGKFGPCSVCQNEPDCNYPDPYCFYISKVRDSNGCVTDCGPLACA